MHLKKKKPVFQIWKNFKSIHFSAPPFFLSVARYDNAAKKGLSSPAKTTLLKYLGFHKKTGPCDVNS